MLQFSLARRARTLRVAASWDEGQAARIRWLVNARRAPFAEPGRIYNVLEPPEVPSFSQHQPANGPGKPPMFPRMGMIDLIVVDDSES